MGFDNYVATIKKPPLNPFTLGCHISPVLRKEERDLNYEDMKNLREENKNKPFKVEVKGIATHRKGRKEFVVVSVCVSGLEKIRSRLKLSSSHPDQVTHITIGER